MTMSEHLATRLRGHARWLLALLVSLVSTLAVAQSNPYSCPPVLTAPAPYDLTLLNVSAAWQQTCGTANIGVIDNGVQFTGGVLHPQLRNNVRLRFSRNLDDPENETLSVITNLEEHNQGTSSRGHGTHVAGLLVATPSPFNNAVGVCPGCSLFVYTGSKLEGQSITRALESGVQVISHSAGWPGGTTCPAPADTLGNQYGVAFCAALVEAGKREVVFVSASGNEGNTFINFPAIHPDAIAVGGVTPSGQFWTGQTVFTFSGNSPVFLGSNSGPQQLVVASALQVTSTFYLNSEWLRFTDPTYDCRNTAINGVGYGPCTGTSMAVPQVAAIVAMMKSANPLLRASEVRSILAHRSSESGAIESGVRLKTNTMAYGYPNAGDAVRAALVGATGSEPLALHGSAKNRLTPLFSLYSASAGDHLYTVFPQVAASAINGTLPPRPLAQLSQSLFEKRCTEFYPLAVCNEIAFHAFPLPTFRVLTADRSAGAPGVRGRFTFFRLEAIAEPFAQEIRTSDVNGDLDLASIAYFHFGDALLRVTLDTVGELRSPYTVFGVDAPGSYIPGCDGTASQPAGCPPAPATPKAIASVFTTHVNPIDGSPQLSPLYRMSWCSELTPGPQGPCTGNQMHVSHVLTSDAAEIAVFQSAGYRLDGIEGFVFPRTQIPQPPDTVKLCRKYSPTSNDYILFTGSGPGGASCGATNDGFTGGLYSTTGLASTDWIGYAYPVRPPTLVPRIASLSISPPYTDTAVVGTSFGTLSVIARDSNGNPVGGIPVSFLVLSSGPQGATLAPGSATTIASGIASTTATANTAPGNYAVRASVDGLHVDFTLTNTVGAPASVTVQSSATRRAPTNSAFAPLTVVVKDAVGNPVPNVVVTFFASVGPAGQSAILAAPSFATTDPSGIASLGATANPLPGTYTVTAFVGSLSTSFALTNQAATTIAPQGGGGQTAIINTPFTSSLSVIVKDQDSLVIPGVAVNFATTPSPIGASAALSAPPWVTDANGVASVNATANAIAGQYSVTASVPGIASAVSFTLTNQIAATIQVAGGDSQSARVGASFPIALSVVVRDQSGNRLPGATVVFSAPTSGPSAGLTSPPRVTDADGVAFVNATANGVGGTFSVAASIGSGSASFTLTNLAPATMQIADGDVQSAGVNTAFARQLSVIVRDQNGAAFSGAMVTFAPPSSGPGATLSAGSQPTNASGVAAVTATANGVTGTYAVTASSPGLPSRTFNLTNTCSSAPVIYESELPEPYPILPSADLAMNNGWTVAFRFTVPAGHDAVFRIMRHTMYTTYWMPNLVRTSVSRCKGDFDVLPACRMDAGEHATVHTTTGADPNYCHVEPGTTYYFNVKQMQCGEPNGNCGLRGLRTF